MNKAKNKILFAAVIKNWNIGEENVSCQNCHMEPKYKFECDSCKSAPWMQF